MRTVGTLSFLIATLCLGLGIYRPEYRAVGAMAAQWWLVLSVWATGQVILAELRRKKEK